LALAVFASIDYIEQIAGYRFSGLILFLSENLPYKSFDLITFFAIVHPGFVIEYDQDMNAVLSIRNVQFYARQKKYFPLQGFFL
jgi:hypothetical protein